MPILTCGSGHRDRGPYYKINGSKNNNAKSKLGLVCNETLSSDREMGDAHRRIKSPLFSLRKV